MQKLTVALLFGGRSVEHEVSVISALQAYENMDHDKYHVIPVYVSKAGEFFTSQKLLDIKNYKDVNNLILSSKQIVFARKGNSGGFLTQGIFGKFTPIDIAFPLFHGSFGEDGCVQGLFEMYEIPYVGFDVTASAVAMDKIMSKALFKELGLEVSKYTWIARSEWIKNPDKCVKAIKKDLGFPMFVKPATGGSSIGAGKAVDEDALQFAIEVASAYSERIIIEESFGKDIIEVNCSALGYGEIKTSVCEQPVKSEELLTFSDKYMRGAKGAKKAGGMETLDRIIPAPISAALSKKIQEAAKLVFKALNGCGVVRIDFFVELNRSSRSKAAQDDTSYRFWINEVNSIPGSLSFYLWEKSGLSFKDLLDQVIEQGLKRAEDRKKTTYVFESNLLEMWASGKVSGSKSQK